MFTDRCVHRVLSVTAAKAIWNTVSNNQGPDFDDMSSFFPCEIDNAIQHINLGYGAQTPKIIILQCIFSSFSIVYKF